MDIDDKNGWLHSIKVSCHLQAVCCDIFYVYFDWTGYSKRRGKISYTSCQAQQIEFHCITFLCAIVIVFGGFFSYAPLLRTFKWHQTYAKNRIKIWFFQERAEQVAAVMGNPNATEVECEQPVEPFSPMCAGHGTYKCERCECDENHFGRNCECSKWDMEPLFC